jgi:hypothetical protein
MAANRRTNVIFPAQPEVVLKWRRLDRRLSPLASLAGGQIIDKRFSGMKECTSGS